MHFRSIFDETLDCEPLTALIGKNGAGKSAFLQALRIYFDPGAGVSDDDYYNRDKTKEILIEVTFTDLTTEEQDEFQSYTDSGMLVVQRRFPSGSYYGRDYGCPQFEQVREKLRAKNSKVSDALEVLKKLVDSGEFPGLQIVRNKPDEELSRWENENKNKCQYYFRAGIFQGPTNIAGGKLRARTRFIYVPPVREAETDASGTSKQSILGTLVAPLVNAITERNKDVSSAKAAVTAGYTTYKSLVTSAPEKATLESDFTNLLQRYASDASAKIQLSLKDDLELPNPSPKVWLVEDGFEGDVAKKGHGLQRLFIFTILELYEKFRNTEGEEANIVLAIEEPELYQHPARSRALAKTLRELSTPPDSKGFRFQVFYTTHSPYFVGLDYFQAIRRVEKTTCPDGAMQSKIKRTTLKEVGDDALKAYNKPGKSTEVSTWARMKSILGINGSEGFFADGIILVEGREDEAILTAHIEHNKISLDSQGICMVAAHGKTNIPLLLALYNRLNIPTFTIFDGDGKIEDINNAILNLLGKPPQEKSKSEVFTNGAVWEHDFAKAIQIEVGKDNWDKACQEARNEYAILADTGRKNFAVVHRAMNTLLSKGQTSVSLDHLWSAIEHHLQLKSKTTR